MFKDKKILVVGGTGMIGQPLVDLLSKAGVSLRIVSLDDSRVFPFQVEFLKLNILSYENCLTACKGMDMVFNLFGVKGSAGITKKRTASFFVPTILGNTNLMEAARVSGIQRYLYTSTVGVYEPAPLLKEDAVWKTFPSENDRFAGWAKRMGELQAEAYKIEYGWDKIAIVRPANVYGPYDNFDPETAMVIPSLIRRIADGENPLVVWGDGSEVRDFIYAKDVAEGMILAMEYGADCIPINLGSGKGVRVRTLVEEICDCFPFPPRIQCDISKKSGDEVRLMDMSRAEEKLRFRAKTSLREGLRETVDWFFKKVKVVDKTGQADKRYNVFKEKRFI